MPKKRVINDLSTRTFSTNISILDDRHVTKIRDKFKFSDDYNLQVELDYAVTNYHLISKLPKEPTPKTSNERLSSIQDRISELTDALANLSQNENISIMRVSENRPQKFYSNDTIEYLNELSLLVAVSISKQGDVAEKAGRSKKTSQSVFLNTLYSIYEEGTGKIVTSSYNNYITPPRYTSLFVEFCEHVFGIYNLVIPKTSIGEFVKKKRKITAKKS